MNSIQHVESLIIGSGVSGSFWAHELTKAGRQCLVLEAGKFFDRDTYPETEADGNAQLYWSGGIELDSSASLAMLRPKVVGGGSIVNQALMDRFYDEVLGEWVAQTDCESLSPEALKPFYDQAESELSIQTIPERYWNENARIFTQGFEKNGFGLSPVRRAQKHCPYEEGAGCIDCLNGCRQDSKQSMPVTVLRKALDRGCELRSEVEVERILPQDAGVQVEAKARDGAPVEIRADHLVLAAGAIGNTKLLIRSGLGPRFPKLGQGFYTHPQYMVLADFDRRIDGFKGPFQVLRSDDERFRRMGFKIENVFAPPAALAMLIPGYGERHQRDLAGIGSLACMEVAIRDTYPGQVGLNRQGKLLIDKKLNAEDRKRKQAGIDVIHKVYEASGARRIHPVRFGIGLHLMGGCALHKEPGLGVVDEQFRLHGLPQVSCSDSSVFPSAPGINPSLTIMALSIQAARSFLERTNHD